MKKLILAILVLGAISSRAESPLNDTDYIKWGGGKTLIYGSSSSGYLRGRVNDSDVWAINQFGFFGIGTNTPATLLDVAGAAQFGAAGTKSAFSSTGALTLASGAAFSAGAISGSAISGTQITLTPTTTTTLLTTTPTSTGTLVIVQLYTNGSLGSAFGNCISSGAGSAQVGAFVWPSTSATSPARACL